ncbi:DNA polymerase III, beta subunit [gamma proteobacterium HTCC5015]|nr:DNA polymerase III, beta subunit [gamma proteobacterium HTCC5015]
MKLHLSRESLLTPLQKVIGAVERKNTMPALGNVLIKAQGGEIQMTATDLEIELLAKSVLPVDQEGDITLPARKLLDICKNLPDGADITLQVDAERATLSSGRSRFKLSTLPAADFPQLEAVQGVTQFTLPQSTLRKVIDKTSFAMAQQDVRYYLNGLMLELDGSTVRAVATDGHRLALCETDAGLDIGDKKQVIIPRKGVQELSRLLDDEERDAEVSLSNNHIQVDLGNLRFTSKLIDGRFPDYQRVMPANCDKVVSADKQDLKLALTRTSVLSNEKYKGVRLVADNGALTIQTNNPEQEEAEEQLEVQYQGENMEIGFNVNYMLDVLNNLTEELVTIALKDANSSCLVEEVGEQTAKYVIMPMRL